ncbi:MAG: hypothetical protein GY832_36425, partial [Chloroflexi bacterium]|nr:hypothetical protein [Chloroflexota bacterium]
LDHCTGEFGILEPWALRIVQEMNSYTEWSPSGHGVHIFVRATLPPQGRKKGNVEMYDRLRFFTVTGNWVPITPLAVESRQAALNALHTRVFPPTPTVKKKPHRSVSNLGDDTALIERAMRAKNGSKFSALWRGDFSGLYPSQSEADLALCSCLAFWASGDPGRVDQLFRQSNLFRPKWDQRHYADGRTYGQATIERALR